MRRHELEARTCTVKVYKSLFHTQAGGSSESVSPRRSMLDSTAVFNLASSCIFHQPSDFD